MNARLTPELAIVDGARRANGPYLLLLAVYSLLLAGYVGVRYGGRSLDGDAVSLTGLSQNVLAEGTLTPIAGAYPFGYAYPALNTFLAHLTGTPIGALQFIVQPFLIVLLVPISYAAYRSLTGRSRVALLASLLLFLSPEFLFEATRSSHAKVTWLLALCMLFILARSFQASQSLRRLPSWVAALYLVAFALITSSAFFAGGYVFGIASAFVVTNSLPYLGQVPIVVPAQMRRLTYVTGSTLLLVFLFIFYLYPPALSASAVLKSTLDKLSYFFLDFESSSSADPYRYVQSTWQSLWVYLALTVFNWSVLLMSFAVWLYQGWLLWMRREDMPAHRLLLWLLYGSFGLLMVLSVLVDLSGALSANLQLRVFPHFLLVGIPLASEGLVAMIGWLRRGKRPLITKVAPVLLVALFSFFSLASLLKITNEPLLSNWWSFYASQEQQLVQWIGSHIRNNQVWTGREARLPTVVLAFGNWSQQGIRIDRSGIPISARYVLMSDITRMRADRIGDTLPDTRQFQRVYDGGGVELFYSRPRTPYQR